MKQKIIFLCLFFLSITTFSQTTRYVTTTGKGSKTGASWDNASDNLQDMIYKSSSGDLVFVAVGKYKPVYKPGTLVNGNRDNSFMMRNGVKLYGGFDPNNNIKTLADIRIVPNENGAPSLGTGTILSGDILNNDTYNADGTITEASSDDNAHHVIVAAEDLASVSIELDGFTISGGNANLESSYTVNNRVIYSSNGGGIYATTKTNTNSYTVTIILTNVNVKNNKSYSFGSFNGGGGIYVFSGGNSIIRLINSIINNNTAISYTKSVNGGGIYSYSNLGTASEINLDNSTITKNKITSNQSDSYGGGISCNSSVILTNSKVSYNEVVSSTTKIAYGGGIYNTATIGEIALTNSLINNNTLTSSTSMGSGIYSNNGVAIDIMNSTIVGNMGDSYINSSSAGINLRMKNTIVYANLKTDNTSATLSSTDNNITYSLVQGINATASIVAENVRNNNLDGTITYTNLFTDFANGNYTLKLGSPAINTGSNNLYVDNLNTAKDLAGNPRLFAGTIDMGAYEIQDVTVLPVNFGEFTAIKQTNNVKLAWNTLSETNNKGFLIEKSTDGINFSALAFLDSKGINANTYTLYDNSPANGTNYYRLIQQDNDGKENELGVRHVIFSLVSSILKIHPNPTENHVSLKFLTNYFTNLRVTDLNGKVLQRIAITTNENSKQISLGAYPAGVYIITLSGKGKTESHKIVKK